MTGTTNVTGRDGYLVRKALAYAIETIEGLPKRWQEQSDQQQMLRLLEAMTDSYAAQRFRICARSHIKRRGLTVKFGELVLADRETTGTVVPFPGGKGAA